MQHDLNPARSYATQGSNPPAEVPDSQRRALERRHALNEQQRQFPQNVPAPHFIRPRPPG